MEAERELIKQLADIVKNLYISNAQTLGITQVTNVCKELDELMAKCEIQAAALPNQQYGEWQLCPKCNGEGYTSGGLVTTSVFVVCNVCNGTKVIAKPVIPALPVKEEPTNKLFYDYGQKLGIKINDLQRLMLLAKQHLLPVKEEESDLGNYEYFKKLTEHFKKNEVQLTPEEFKTLNDSFSKRLSKTPTRLDDQQVKEEGNHDAQ